MRSPASHALKATTAPNVALGALLRRAARQPESAGFEDPAPSRTGRCPAQTTIPGSPAWPLCAPRQAGARRAGQHLISRLPRHVQHSPLPHITSRLLGSLLRRRLTSRMRDRRVGHKVRETSAPHPCGQKHKRGRGTYKTGRGFPNARALRDAPRDNALYTRVMAQVHLVHLKELLAHTYFTPGLRARSVVEMPRLHS
ncbi:hypothetical protein NDU88_008040 [Pleurodeles waltl]|uniref:Uncharacterized protein n=1 Tax=Pleurodeles waltl TaxID=8319 RepID=A0AAV7N5V1_PLEWA|nr:hypothetical protein NDU88_008040 [Pleurodeles waltl]